MVTTPLAADEDDSRTKRSGPGNASPGAAGPRSRGRRLLALLTVPLLAALFAVLTGLWSVRTPEVAPETAPADEFSASRAYAHAAALAREPHHAGTAGLDRVRAELVRRITDLGLEPRTRSGTGADTGSGAAMVGWTRNISATVPGTDPTGRILVVAHYDSAETSHGASDNALGVATALETARALRAGPAPRNDVVFLFTDAEEPGMLGARAFVAQEERERRDGQKSAQAGPRSTVVLNLEARGTSGRVVMFETGPGNGPLLATLGGSPPPATSLSDEVYGLLPNDTDFTVLREAGMTGMNFAVIGGSARYHTPEDDLTNLSRPSLQDMGGTVLSSARQLAAADVPALRKGGDATWFTLGPWLVRYPGELVLPLAAASLAVLAGALAAARRAGALRLREVALAAAGLPLALLVSGATACALWPLALQFRPEWSGFALGGVPYRPGAVALAAVLVAASAAWLWASLLRARVGVLAAGAAVCGGFALLAVVSALWLPGAAYLFTWPALTGALALAVAARTPSGSPWREALAGAALVPAAALFTPVVLLLLDALPLAAAGVPALLVTLCLALWLPAPAARTGRRAVRGVPVFGLAGALAAAGLGVAGGGATAARPEQVVLVYTQDADTGRAAWASGSSASGWLGEYVGGEPRPLAGAFPSLDEPGRRLTGPVRTTPTGAVPVPGVEVLSSRSEGGVRHLKLRVRASGARAAELALYADTSAGAPAVTGASVAGHRVPGGVNRSAAADSWGWGLLLSAPPRDGVEVRLSVRGDGPLRLRTVAMTPGLPAGSLHVPRPADITWSGADSGLTLVSRGVRV